MALVAVAARAAHILHLDSSCDSAAARASAEATSIAG